MSIHHLPTSSISTKPAGYSCAAIAGINPNIVSRANELATLSARGENLIAACAVLSDRETQVLEEAVRDQSACDIMGRADRTT